MWKTFSWQDEVFMVNMENVEDQMHTSVTNLKTIWFKIFTIEEMSKKFIECNPRIEKTDDKKLLDLILKLLNNLETSTIECKYLKESLSLTIETKLSDVDINYKFEFILDIGDNKMVSCFLHNNKFHFCVKFTEKVTYPMITTIKYLEDQNKLITNLLEKKDREIEEYKIEYGNISRHDLVTEKYTPFNNDNQKILLNTFGQSKKFWTNFINKCTHSNIEVNEIKTEPEPKKKKLKIFNKSKKTKGLNFH
ncbi:unnamed protein product [Brassicogethes aeneus]|uniref:Non-homologous end-joining factor 1 n=1 Tax=Brassicogethes aeneus TaxID=1431903 RepID=A0A9P0FG44_BRAAE|nr:unnamed protein product [Brassicogethes aeneus]